VGGAAEEEKRTPENKREGDRRTVAEETGRRLDALGAQIEENQKQKETPRVPENPVKLKTVEIPALQSETQAAGLVAIAALLTALWGKLMKRENHPESRMEQQMSGEQAPVTLPPQKSGEERETGPQRSPLEAFLGGGQRGSEVIGARNRERTNREAMRNFVREELQREGKDIDRIASSLSPEQAYEFANAFVMDRMKGTAEDQRIASVSWDPPEPPTRITVTLNPAFTGGDAGPYTFSTTNAAIDNAGEQYYRDMRVRDQASVVKLLTERKGVCRHYAECVAAVFQVLKDAQPEKFSKAFVRHTDTIAAWRLLRRVNDENAVKTLNQLGHHAFTTLYVNPSLNPKVISFDAAGLDIQNGAPGKPHAVAEDLADAWSIFAYVEMEEAGVITREQRRAQIQHWVTHVPQKPANLTPVDWDNFKIVAQALATA